MFDVAAVQLALRQGGWDGWLLYDFRGSNVLARRVLGLESVPPGSRRWACFVPAEGEPRKLVHRIETGALDSIPGTTTVYLKWQEFEAGIATLVGNARRVAMEYSPRLQNPYVSRVDAGLVELVTACGAQVESSQDLIVQFEALWTPEQWRLHQEAGLVTNSAYDVAWSAIADGIRRDGFITERQVQQRVLHHFDAHGLTTYAPPIVGVNAHSGDPHYETSDAEIRRGDYVLLDLWGKLNQPRAVYSDLTRVAMVGQPPSEAIAKVFSIVTDARDTAIRFIEEAVASGRPLGGYEVDRACRAVIERAGYGAAFVHRTGHSIGQETHGNGPNIDDLETRDTRLLVPGCGFSIEPGIYLPEFGVRSEVNVFIDYDRQVHVTAGERQTQVHQIVLD